MNAPAEPKSPKGSDKPKAKERAAKKQKPKGPWQTFRENAEAIVVAVILALIIRHFSLEAFEIPTGSMAPGLNGVHVESTCPNCGTVSEVGVHTDPHSGKVDARWREGVIYVGKGKSDETIESYRSKPGVRVPHPDRRIGYIDADPEGFRTALHSAFDAWCPECNLTYTEVFEPSDCIGGHKILVNKFIYFLREPRRWEVIVFKFNRQRNYIKRLIGLPGETVQVVSGDIWINGEIERKPPRAQRELWFPVNDTAIAERGYSRTQPWGTTDATVWESGEKERAFLFRALEGSGRLTYQRPITNQYAYNCASPSRDWGQADGNSRPPHANVETDWWVRDLRLTADVVIVGGRGTFELRIKNGQKTYRCRIPAGNGQVAHPVEFWLDDEELRKQAHSREPEDSEIVWSQRLAQFFADGETEKGAATRLIQNVEHEVDFYLADRQLVLAVDGDTVATLPFEEEGIHRIRPGARASVALHVGGITGHVGRLQVHRDIHYTSRGHRYKHATVRPFSLDDEDYFAMGDNSPSSLDSRAWGAVSKENMLGRAFGIFWPALPWRFEIGFIR